MAVMLTFFGDSWPAFGICCTVMHRFMRVMAGCAMQKGFSSIFELLVLLVMSYESTSGRND
jgi:hypothetical protein